MKGLFCNLKSKYKENKILNAHFNVFFFNIMRVQKEITLECTINLHKRTYGVKFKNRVSRAVKEIKKFAQKSMGVNDVRIDSNLNKELCKNGSRNVPFKIKVRLFKKHCVSEKGNELWIVFVNSQKSFLRV